MNKRCSVCNHPSRAEIDRGLLTGVPYRPLAAQHGLSPSSLSRHLRHLKQEIALQERQAHQARQQAILDHLELLSVRLDRLFQNATDFHSLHVALGCLRESLRLVTLQERLRHSLRRHP
jgi:hypothetical protein